MKTTAMTLLQIATVILIAVFVFLFVQATWNYSKNVDERRQAHTEQKIDECRDLGGNPVIENWRGDVYYKECVLPKEE